MARTRVGAMVTGEWACSRRTWEVELTEPMATHRIWDGENQG